MNVSYYLYSKNHFYVITFRGIVTLVYENFHIVDTPPPMNDEKKGRTMVVATRVSNNEVHSIEVTAL